MAKKNRQKQQPAEAVDLNTEFAEETAASNAAKAAQKQQQNNQK